MAEVDLRKYRKVVKAKDGSIVVLRPLEAADQAKLVEMFGRLPVENRRILQHNVTDEELIASWVEEADFERVFPLVAQVDDDIVADATLHRYPGTSRRHVGQLRIVTGPKLQGKGLGTIMLQELINLSEKLGLEQLMAQIPIGPEPARIAQRAFENMGFEQQAVFKDYFKTADGVYYDVGILFLALIERWKEF